MHHLAIKVLLHTAESLFLIMRKKKQFVRRTNIKCHRAVIAIRYDVTVAVSQDVVGR